MDRTTLLREWHSARLAGYIQEIDHLIDRPVKYLDPRESCEPSTGQPLFDRVTEQRVLLQKDFPEVAEGLPRMKHTYVEGVGLHLDREELRQLRREVVATFELLKGL